MATVMLMRHGKSDWSTDAGADHDRPLAPRGEKAAVRIGRFLTNWGCEPDLVMTSTALRATSTAERAHEAGRWHCSIEQVAGFYGGDIHEIAAIVRSTSTSVQSMLLIGHNPTWEVIVSNWIGGGRLRFPTAAVACIGFPDSDWSQIGQRRGELLWFVNPRLLG